MIADFVDGRPDKVSGYLIRYNSENPSTAEGRKAFAGRIKRLYNENVVRPYLEVHVSHMSQPIDLTLPETGVWKEIKADVTQYGQDFTKMAEELLLDYCRDGIVGVLVDQESTVPATKAEAQAQKTRSYQVKYSGTEIFNWEYFRSGPKKGKLSKLLLSNGTRTVDNKERRVLREYTSGETGPVTWIDYLVDLNPKISKTATLEGEPIDKGVLGEKVTEIPFAIMGEGPEKSFVLDSTHVNCAMMNRLSVRDNVNHYQGFKKSIVAGGDAKELEVMSESTITHIADRDVTVHSIDAGDPIALTDQIGEMRVYARRVGMKENNQMADDSKNIQSSESKEKDSKARRKLYDVTLNLLTAFLKKIYSFHAMFEGESDAKIAVSIGREYGLDDKVQEAAQHQQVFSMAGQLGVRSVQKETLKTGVSKLRFVARDDGTTEDEVRQELYDDIDAAEPGSQLASQVNLNGRPNLGAELTQ
jgi:hypothetical protein